MIPPMSSLITSDDPTPPATGTEAGACIAGLPELGLSDAVAAVGAQLAASAALPVATIVDAVVTLFGEAEQGIATGAPAQARGGSEPGHLQ